MYILSIEKSFCAGHQLRDYNGPCARLHGHNWQVRVEVATDKLDRVGISIDFEELESITWDVLKPLDHNHLNDIPPFNKINPTAENIARYIYEAVQLKLPNSVKLQRVDVWETETYKVSYVPEE
jgi:6-pyruvoyltetrahydropterin/6-carboxytetrahydropterin synthase